VIGHARWMPRRDFGAAKGLWLPRRDFGAAKGLWLPRRDFGAAEGLWLSRMDFCRKGALVAAKGLCLVVRGASGNDSELPVIDSEGNMQSFLCDRARR
jgi:hypothetical protein